MLKRLEMHVAWVLPDDDRDADGEMATIASCYDFYPQRIRSS